MAANHDLQPDLRLQIMICSLICRLICRGLLVFLIAFWEFGELFLELVMGFVWSDVGDYITHEDQLIFL